ncbi:O-antigen ligase family protein [Candidatus Saccharibacteria bacterium]|nr:O-antigen ligase family protein [Candidatus Saccharibacteria bacterium]MBI3337876.1 O-antigen ligase family protein [Candidatus Saccharibacteria bacterium]
MNDVALTRKLSWIIAIVLILLPFHAFFTTWLGSNFGHLDSWRIWKELIIVALSPLAIWLAWREPSIKKWLKTSWLPRLILLYTFVYIILGARALLIGNVNRNALIYGLLIDLRFLGFFMICLVVSSKNEFLKRHWQKIVVIPALIVISFGILQRFVLPYDFLKHFGYGPKTIPAYQTVDNKIDYRRIQSTLRGANPLGAYLVLAIMFLWMKRHKVLNIIALAVAGTALFYTYSRSAWLGLFIAAGLFSYWSLRDKKAKQYWYLTAVIFIVVTLAGVVIFRNNQVVQNTVFHTDTTSTSVESSNEDRVEALNNGIQDVVREPIGRGPGTAGPASFRNNHTPRIAENYFLQVGQEVGWLGMMLFMMINLLVARLLWQQKQDILARILLAVFVGLTIVNMFSHAWTDDTLALLWWGMTGIALSVMMNKKQKHVQI